MRGRTLFLFGGTLVALIAGGVLFFREFNRVFPDVRPGVYGGVLVPVGGGAPVPLLVEATVGSADLFVSVGDDEFPAQRAVVVDLSSKTRLPLIITGASRRLRLTGNDAVGEGYRGDYVDPMTSEKGTWQLSRREVPELGRELHDELGTWAVVWQAFQVVQNKIFEADQRVEADKARIDKLSKSVGEDDALREVGASRLSSTSSTVDEVKRSIDARRKELESLLQEVEIAQKVSAEGRLVELSSEAIKREGRWVEHALKLTAPEVSGNFDADYERALKVKALQDQISDERGLLRNIEEAPRYRDNASERDKEEEFYNGLQ
jgi:hypothetical protein